MSFGTYFLPGPTEVRPEVLQAMMRPMIAHRGVEFERIFSTLQDGLRPVFRTQRPVYISTSSATGLMEAGIRCAPDGRILSLVNGAFSGRFANIAVACGREVDRYDVAWGDVHEPDHLLEMLRARRYAAITVVHSETSTGALNNVHAIVSAAHSADVVCIVDSVSGVGGAVLEFDAWDMDYALTCSQKALALPPGLAFAVASESFIESARRVPRRGVYFDIVEFDEYARKNQTPSTPALSLYYALESQLSDIAVEGMPARWARHAEMAALTHSWVDTVRAESGLAVGILAAVGARSPTVTTVTLPPSVSGEALVSAVADRGFTIGSGYGKLKNGTIRIGHMGDHTAEGLQHCLAACRDALLALT